MLDKRQRDAPRVMIMMGWRKKKQIWPKHSQFLMFQNVPGGSAFKPRTHIGEENITRVCILGLLSTNHF